MMFLYQSDTVCILYALGDLFTLWQALKQSQPVLATIIARAVFCEQVPSMSPLSTGVHTCVIEENNVWE